MDTKKLRQKILDLAIRGKLVPQDSNDEPASVLLERIKAEKERLIKEGKIKRSKKSAKTSDTPHYPYLLPKGWVWTILPELCIIPITDGTHQTPTYTDKEHGIPFISSKDVTSQRINWDNVKYITKELHEELYRRIAPQKDDILLAKNGTTGVAAIVEDSRVFDIYVTLAVIRPSQNIYPRYLYQVINSNFCKEQFNNHLTGIGLPNLHLVDIKKTIIPLPPFAEQQRIVAEIEKWFALIDQIEQEKSDLQTIIKQTKSKILDLAIHGKLVPQDPNDEPAIELLKRINPNFTPCDNGHSEKFPQDWEHILIGDYVETVTDFVASGSFASLRENVKYYNEPNYAILVRTKDFQNNFKQDLVYTDQHGYDFLAKSNLFGGELIFSNVGSIGKIFIVPELNQKMTLAPNAIMVRFHNDKQQKWFYYLFSSTTGQSLLDSITSATAIGKFNKTDFKKLPIPIPPLAEQQRIVQKIEELFSVLDNIQKALEV